VDKIIKKSMRYCEIKGEEKSPLKQNEINTVLFMGNLSLRALRGKHYLPDHQLYAVHLFFLSKVAIIFKPSINR
jgi:hypothetical protein